MRSSTADTARRLNAIVRFSLEEALEFVSEDELVGQAYRLPRAPRELLPAGHLALTRIHRWTPMDGVRTAEGG